MSKLKTKITNALIPLLYKKNIAALPEPPKPFDEMERLATLRGLNVLDTPKEDRFDRITRTTARMLQVPISLVTIVDANRQWFKSCYGTDLGETPRSVSFCSYAILQDGVFVIPDTLKDPRFAQNPLVTGIAHIRFYAGMPVSGPDGRHVGTLCILDRKPREMTKADRDTLRDLANWVELELNFAQTSRALEERKKAEQKYQDVFDQVEDVFFELGGDGVIRDISPSCKRFSGHTPDQVIGKPASVFFSKPALFAELMALLQKKGRVRDLEAKLQTATGKSIVASINARIVTDPSGAPRAVVGILRNITERVAESDYLEAEVARRTAQALKSLEKEKELEELKNSFIRIVSHQLRTPLNAVRWNLEMMLTEQMGKLRPEQKEFLRLTYQSDVEVIRRIDDLLTAMDIEEKRINLKKQELSFGGLFDSVWNVWREKGKYKNIHFEFEPSVASKTVITVDADRLRSAIDKLVDNAVTYSHDGGRIIAKIKKQAGNVVLTIEDHGIGVPKEEQKRLFQRFYRASNASTMKADASGLGLFIAKSFVRKHGGTIVLKSKEGKGTTVVLRIPIATKGKRVS